jgi:5-methylcytosine-specific restriction endonuclease McrA
MRSTPHLCAYPGCAVIVDDGPGRCGAHGLPARRGTAGYGWSWSRVRNAYLASLPDPRCARCGARGVTLDVHHRDGRRPTDVDANDWANLEALCRRCHRLETTRAAKRRSAASEAAPRSTPLVRRR